MSSFKRLVQPECGAPNPLVQVANQLNGTSMPPGTARARLSSLSGPAQTAKDFVGEFMSQQQQQIQNITDNFTLNNIPMAAQHIIGGPPHAATANGPYQWSGEFLNKQQLDRQWEQEFSAKTSAVPVIPISVPSTSTSTQITNHSHIGPSYNAQFQYLHRVPPLAATVQSALLYQVASEKQEGVLKGEEMGNLVEKVEEMLGPSQKHKDDQEQSSKTVTKDSSDSDLEFWQNLAGQTMPNESASKTETDERVAGDQNWFDATTYDMAEPQSNYIFDDTNPLKDKFQDPLSEGIKKLEQGDIPSAVLLFEAAVQKEPSNSMAWRYLGTTQAQNENDSLAIRALEQCCQLDANDLVARLALSVSLANETKHRSACIQLIEWIRRNPAYQELMKSRNLHIRTEKEVYRDTQDSYGITLINDKEYETVKGVFVAAARISPNNPDPEVQCALGVLFNLRGEYLKASDCFKAALSVRPEDSLLWNRLGATLANGSRSEEAVSAYRQALKLSPGFLRSRYNLAVSCINLNSYREAAEQLVTVLNIQAAGRGLNNSRARIITSTNVWNTLRTVVTLMNRPDLYSYIDGKNLDQLNREFLSPRQPLETTTST